MAKNTLDWIAFVLVIIGGLNWGLAVFNVNLVEMLVGAWPVVAKIVYALVGIAALYMIYYLVKKSK